MNKMHSEKISTATSTSSSETRKNSKPIMEKRRRARMNASLTELKSLLLEVMKKDGNRHSKMEKADILEMTVKHLRHLQRQHFTVPTTKEESPFLTKYTLGFQECTSEVSRYLSSVAEIDVDVRARLINHLATYISQPSSPSAVSSTASSPTSTTAATAITAPVSRPSSVTDTSPRQSPASLTSPPSPSATSTPQLVAPPQPPPPPPPPPAQIQLQLAPSLAQSASSVQSSQISVSTAQTTTRPESMVAPKQITIFPADFCTATTTTTATTFTAPAAGGILSLDTSCPQVQTAKLLSGVQLITTRLPNGQMAFILPTNLMTETQQTQQQQPRQQTQQSYIPIPVYAPTSPAISPLTTTVGGTPGVMALLPQVSKTGVTPTASMAFMPHLFPFPQMAGINSSISHLPLVSADTSEAATAGAVTGLTVPVKMSSSVTEINPPVLLPELTKKLASTPVIQPQPSAIRVENNVVEPAPVLQQIEEENVWRPWAH